MKAFRVLYEDASFIAVDKPAGFHSHPPENKAIKVHPAWNGLRILERQFGQKLFSVHRLDRATSGILLLAKNKETAHILHAALAQGEKNYYCITRGTISASLSINRALTKKSGTKVSAITEIMPLYSFSYCINDLIQSFTIVCAKPKTGRFHQIRRHLAGIGHPILGDKKHGDKKLNRAFASQTTVERMFLRSMKVILSYEENSKVTVIRNRWSKDWHKLFELAGYCPIVDCATLVVGVDS